MLYLDCIPLDVTLHNQGEIEIDTILTYIILLVGAEGFPLFLFFITIVKAEVYSLQTNWIPTRKKYSN